MTSLTNSENSKSFVWEDFVCHIQSIRYQMMEGIKYLDRRWANGENNTQSGEIASIDGHRFVWESNQTTIHGS